MTDDRSIVAKALGADFDRLHPRMQERFAFTSADRRACVGTGVMSRVWRGGPHTAPFLRLGAVRNIAFPETGTDVPFSLECYAYQDGLGRETLAFVRTFELRPRLRRRFDATMVYDADRGCVVYLLGTHQHLAVDLHPGVEADGSLRIRSGAQRFSGSLGVGLPLGLSGDADLRQSYDEDLGRFRIDVRVTNRHLGPVFGYTGTFTVAYPHTEAVPRAAMPLREKVAHR